jgi:hypothetical protein
MRAGYLSSSIDKIPFAHKRGFYVGLFIERIRHHSAVTTISEGFGRRLIFGVSSHFAD